MLFCPSRLLQLRRAPGGSPKTWYPGLQQLLDRLAAQGADQAVALVILGFSSRHVGRGIPLIAMLGELTIVEIFVSSTFPNVIDISHPFLPQI